MNRLMGQLYWGGESTEKEFGQEVSQEDLGLDRGRVLNLILEEYIVNVDFVFNCP
jgi:hypothetical protein